MTTRSISIFLLGVGLLGGLLILGFVALLAGFFGNTSPWNLEVIGKLILWFGWLFIGPLLLIAGAILTIMGTRQRAGSILSLVGSFILTAMVGYQAFRMLHNLADPHIAKPQDGEYVIYLIAVVLIFLVNLAAVELYRRAELRQNSMRAQQGPNS
jgi:hypothetical protein